MRRICTLLVVSFSLLSAAMPVVVAGAHFPAKKLSHTELERIYLGKIRYLHGQRLIPLNLPPNAPLRKTFETDILHKSERWLNRYWLGQHYRGHRPPKVVPSVDTMIRYLQKIDSAVGYMDRQRARKAHLNILYPSEPR